MYKNSKHAVDSGRVVERVMRMGIEHRGGIPLDDLHDLAVKQLREESKNVEVKSTFETLHDWFNEMSKNSGIAYAFMYNDENVLEVFRFNSIEGFKLDYWRNETMPQLSRV